MGIACLSVSVVLVTMYPRVGSSTFSSAMPVPNGLVMVTLLLVVKVLA